MPAPIRRKPWRGGPNWNMVHGIRHYVDMAPPAPENPAVEAAINTAMTPGKRIHIGTIPHGAFIKGVTVKVSEAFDGAAAYTIGTDDDPDGILTAGDAAVGAAGVKANLAGGTLVAGQAPDQDLELFALLTGTPTVGQLDVLIEYYHNRD